MVSITPIIDKEEPTVEAVKEEESYPILRPGNKRTNINKLIEKQNAGLENIKKINEITEELGGEDIIKEISENTSLEQDEDITIVTDNKEEFSGNNETVNEKIYDLSAESKPINSAFKETEAIFDYNKPISDTTFSSLEEEQEILGNLKDTLKSLNATSESASIMAEDLKKVMDKIDSEDKEIHVVENKKDDNDSFAIAVDESEVEVNEKTVEEPKDEKDKDDDIVIEIEDKDASIFTEVQTLLEEDLYITTKNETSDVVVPLSDLETIARASDDSDPRNYRDVVKDNPLYEGFINKLRTVIRDPKSYLHRIHRAEELFYTAQQNFNRDALEAAVKRNDGSAKNLTRTAKIGEKVVKDIMADKEESLRKIDDGATIKGNLAVTTAVMLTQGIKRVQLYNSGFNIDIRAPKLSELAEYWRESTSTQDEYGRLLGQLCYLPADIHYKRAAMNLLEKLVVNSNLRDFSIQGVLRKAISFLDFDTVMWAISSLMFPKGLEVDYICHNGNCRYTEKSKISVNDMRYNDWSLLDADSILYTISNEKRSLEDLEEYRKSIKNKNVTKKINDEWSAVFRIPTMYEIEESQLGHLAELSQKIQLTSLRDAAMYIAVKYYGILATFTEKLVYKSPKSGKVINIVSETLPSTLEALQGDADIDFAKTVNDFINDTKITHICFTFNKCPSCGGLPTSAIGHLIPCDVHRTFFTWMNRRLTERV